MKLDGLKPFSTCDISDALRKIGKNDFFIPDLVSFSRSKGQSENEFRFMGLAYTIKVENINNGSVAFSEEGFHWLDRASSDNVVIITSPKGAINAVFGGLMGARAISLGVKGVVVGGRVRDTPELNSFGLNVLAIGKSSMGAGGFTHVTGVNVPIDFHLSSSDEGRCVSISPGDVVVCDQDGTVVVPQDCIELVIEHCKKIVDVDSKCMDDITSGVSIFQAFKNHR